MSSVTTAEPSEEYPSGLIITGSQVRLGQLNLKVNRARMTRISFQYSKVKLNQSESCTNEPKQL